MLFFFFLQGDKFSDFPFAFCFSANRIPSKKSSALKGKNLLQRGKELYSKRKEFAPNGEKRFTVIRKNLLQRRKEVHSRRKEFAPKRKRGLL